MSVSSLWTSWRSSTKINDEPCQIDACDHGRRHQLIHVKLVDYLPKIRKSVRNVIRWEYTSHDVPYRIGVPLPRRFNSLAGDAEAADIITEYLRKRFSPDVDYCRVINSDGRNVTLGVWFL